MSICERRNLMLAAFCLDRLVQQQQAFTSTYAKSVCGQARRQPTGKWKISTKYAKTKLLANNKMPRSSKLLEADLTESPVYKASKLIEKVV